jgi:AcrR family transcriptional regulator
MLGETNVDRNASADGGDRRSRRREATKAEILDAAWAIAREHGLTAISLRDLASRVGMRAPSLYQYFDSKHAIYDAMFEQGARQSLETMTEPIDSTDAREVLQISARRLVQFFTSDPARASLLFQRTIPGFEPSPKAYAPAVEMRDAALQRLAEFGITDPDAIDMWTALVSGLGNQQIANDPGGTRWIRLIDRAVDMYLAEVAPQLLKTKKGKK